jgi:tRNA (cmo5U34)-methyltransferase
MSHSVESHLAVTPEAYDAMIRRFVPGYDAMLGEVTEALLRLRSVDAPLHIVDLGAGTGALSSCLAERLPRARFTLIDADATMLARAEARLAAHRQRVELLHGSFSDTLPRCDVAVASLSLHHVHDAADKGAVYANVRRCLEDGGLLLNADATVPRAPELARSARDRWAAHLVEHGDTTEQAHARFAEWAKEDRYFPIEEELDMLRAAGFAAVDVLWRMGPSSVLLAMA